MLISNAGDIYTRFRELFENIKFFTFDIFTIANFLRSIVEKHGRAEKRRELREIKKLCIDTNEKLVVTILSTN